MRALLKTELVLETRGTQFGAILAAALGFKIDGPHFVGKAIVTSDGFVQCNFVDRNGVARHSAFVGSVEDLVRNTKGFADYRKLDETDRNALYSAIHGWVAIDYSNGRALKGLELCVTA